MAEENDTLKLTSVNYTTDNYLAAKKNEDGSYNVAGKVVFNEDITTPGGNVATKADLDGKQDQLTSENAGDNITITGEGSTLKINAAGGSGEVKSDTWYCKCLTQDMDAGFDDSSITTIPGVTAAWSWGDSETSPGHNAKIVFEKQLSITEVNNALCHFEMWSGPIFTANAYYAFAMCPMDDELEAMIPSYAEKIK